MKKAVQFGAGKIGRGFLAQLYHQSGYKVVFVDVIKEMVDEINRRGEYFIHIAKIPPDKILIRDIEAIWAGDERAVAETLAEADIASTAVGVHNIGTVAPLLAQGMMRRKELGVKKPLNVIVCENMLKASEVLFEAVLEHTKEEDRDYVKEKLGCVESVVSRMVPVITPEEAAGDKLYIRVEEYSILPADKRAFKGDIPQIQGMIPYDNLYAYEERKLFTHNAGHAVAAYLGYIKGYKYMWEVMEDAQILEHTRAAMWESGEALIKKHGFLRQEYNEHVEDLLARFANKALGDTVARVARDPIRKLGPQDRLVGAARLAESFGVLPENLALGIGAAFLYNDGNDQEAVRLQQMITEKGIERVMEEICGIKPQEKLGQLVLEKYKLLTNWEG